ncbi:MAG: Na/Pi cotransporter family protein [Pontiellaceae bacterium]|nr:Na/Pi cotransporter family protein [Pontiellaceae bacterium]MBN2786275.1 Na/Pi cotransporter family protein [Pontiellaceae bacterium]
MNIGFGMALDVAGGLGLFLLGMKHMSEGIQAIAGDRLRKMIAAVTNNRFLAILVGVIVTSLIQSSSVTTVMVVGFVNSGIMSLMQAIGVIFGANIGTTITGWIVAGFPIGKWGLPILGIAAFFFLFSKNERLRYTGMSIMGLGMVFFGLSLMSNGFKPLRTMPEFQQWLHAFDASTYLGVLKCAMIGCILTMIVQSSSAMLAITITLANQGTIEFPTAAALVLGENIGTTITAVLASLGTGVNARRAAGAHVVFNLIGVFWITLIFQQYLPFIERLVAAFPDLMSKLHEGKEPATNVGIQIAAVHTVFNVINTILFIPLFKPVAKLVTKLVPDKKTEEINHLTFLDIRMLDTPSLGILQSQGQINFMAESVEGMMGKLRTCLDSDQPDPELSQKIFHREEILDNVQKEIFLFLSQLTAGQVPQEITQQAHMQMRIADEYESLSDYAANVLKGLRKLEEMNLSLDEPARDKLIRLHERVALYISKINAMAKQGKKDTLPWAIEEGASITSMMKEFRRQHLERLQKEEVSPFFSLAFTDMLNYYRRMKDHALNIVEVVAGEK